MKRILRRYILLLGVVYDDMDNEQDSVNERIRLDRFFRAVAEASHSLYPQGFFGKLKVDEAAKEKRTGSI